MPLELTSNKNIPTRQSLVTPAAYSLAFPMATEIVPLIRRRLIPNSLLKDGNRAESLRQRRDRKEREGNPGSETDEPAISAQLSSAPVPPVGVRPIPELEPAFMHEWKNESILQTLELKLFDYF